MREHIRFASMSHEEKVDALPQTRKDRINASSSYDRDAQTLREIRAHELSLDHYLLTLGFLNVGLNRILEESVDVRSRTVDFMDARRQLIAHLWLAMESAGLGRIVSDKDSSYGD